MARCGLVGACEYASEEGWLHRVANPRSIDELASAVRDSELVSTRTAMFDRWALPTPVKTAIWRDNFTSYLGEESDGCAGEDEGLVDERMAREELARLHADLAGQHLPQVTLLGSRLPREIEHHASDQVVIIRGRVTFQKLQAKLAETGQCIPHGTSFSEPAALHRTPVVRLESAIGFNLPHVLSAQCGSWRDWVLGMTVVLPDGTIAKTGSQAVKNVAGYDVHKLFIGGRSTLAIVCEVTFRTLPIAALPKPELETGLLGERWLSGPVAERRGSRWVQRTKPSDFAYAVRSAGYRLLVADHASSTLWAIVPPEESLDRFGDDWVVRSGCGEKNLVITDPTQIRLMKRTKDIFDPTHKLNPGEMGIF